ncbi:formiminotetrahydrofolate cyclodeaminase [Marmoricola bigeumensis]|uniref:Formiminotetrahydrofolate cyclodeaminase n=1 Tax=Nocardioides marmoribigeumensis TaxID=433649 RepID=A0ABU2BQD0_9ACTN|nr:formiminotetrahydrofolate cyclodeaminase [Nocardioides marmoribigeumensis]
MTAALAASLAAMSAGSSSRELPDADALVARAEEARDRLLPLAQQDGEVYADVLTARRRPASPDRDAPLRAALERASEVPLELARAAAEVAQVADRVVAEGNPHLRGDAETAGLLARTALTAAVGLVEANLSRTDPDHPSLVEARSLAARVSATR